MPAVGAIAAVVAIAAKRRRGVVVMVVILRHQRASQIEQAGAQVCAVAKEVAGAATDGEEIGER